ncbi:RNA-directed DNA polymerase, eukaryota, reverse transcriptase zinc-binding domain protein [Tanacetum coccineum]
MVDHVFIKQSVICITSLLNGYAILDKKARYAVANGSGYAVSGSIPDQMEFREEVDEALPDVRVTAIDHLWSDHNLILLHVSKFDFGPTPFKFFHSWLLCDSFDESIEEKIKAGSANDDDHDSRIKLLQEVDILVTLNPLIFFKRRVSNGISKFKDHDLNLDFPLFANSFGLCALDRDRLETHVSLDEVKNSVWGCGSSKAPSLDGFSFTFEKKYWDYIKVDIMKHVNIFLDTGSLPHGSNSSFFTLIPMGLHNALSIAVSSCLIRGVKFASPKVTISHLFYADDVIITTEWNANDLDNIIRVLQVFCLASGLKINIHKSNVYGIGVSDVDVSFMASNSGCAS